jgi:hypothetical protein
MILKRSLGYLVAALLLWSGGPGATLAAFHASHPVASHGAEPCCHHMSACSCDMHGDGKACSCTVRSESRTSSCSMQTAPCHSAPAAPVAFVLGPFVLEHSVKIPSVSPAESAALSASSLPRTGSLEPSSPPPRFLA